MVRQNPFLWQICHLLLHRSSIIPPAETTFRYDPSHSCVGACDPILSSHRGQRVITATVTKLLVNVLYNESGDMLILGEDKWMFCFLRQGSSRQPPSNSQIPLVQIWIQPVDDTLA